MQSISDYLVEGEGVWYQVVGDSLIFHNTTAGAIDAEDNTVIRSFRYVLKEESLHDPGLFQLG